MPTAPFRVMRPWRARLLQGLLNMGVLVGLVPALLSLERVRHAPEDWGQPAIAWLVLTLCAVVAFLPRLGYPCRARLTVALIYGLGMWLLVRAGAVTLIYLLACPLIAVLLLGKRPAMHLLGLCTLSLIGLGWGLYLGPPMPSLESRPITKWLNMGANFLFVGGLTTLSVAFLLRRLEEALIEQSSVSESLRASEEHLRQVAAQVPGMVFRVRYDEQGVTHYLYASPGAHALLGLTPAELLSGTAKVMGLVHPDDQPRLAAALDHAGRTGARLSVEFRVQLADGQEKWIHANSSEVADGPDGPEHSGLMVDVTERRTAEARLWHQAHYDALTGLPNRSLLHERLDEAIARARLSDTPLALLLIDLDHFKEVNDTLGHVLGDQLLVEAGRRIGPLLREGDTVARMGGDEYAVLLPRVDDPARPAALAQALIDALSRPFLLGHERADLSASVGISLFPDDAGDRATLVKHADQALYAAKDGGRRRHRGFDRRLQDEAERRMRLATELHGALGRGQFHVVYQPIVELLTGRVVKAEALLRWTHPELGSISPAVFIPIAETTGLIGEIGDWVFHTAVDQVATWRERLDPQFQISVNRSPVQFRSDAGAFTPWGQHLAERGLPGQCIAVEITEGLLLDDDAGVIAQLQALQQAGMSVSLDDFGTGYSAMAYLQKFKLHTLKIDRRFVSGMQQDDTGRALCKAIIVLAHELGMRVVAEGVETIEQRDWLRAAGCDHGQGYWFARPMPPAEFEAWTLAQRQRASALPARPSPAEALHALG